MRRLHLSWLAALGLMAWLGLLGAVSAMAAEKDPSPKYKDEVVSSGALGGLYLYAGEGAPVVLIIPGSGPTDLNGNNPLGVKANTYQLLAQALYDKGISTVRVDKRGMFSSAKAGDPNAVTVEIYAKDYSDWINSIMTKTGASCVYLLGHSEGSLMASAAANINDHVCGLILVSGPGHTFGDLLRTQLKANPANVLIMDDAMRAISELESGEKVDVSDMHPALKNLFAPPVQAFLISIMAVKPDELAKTANVRTLVLQGDNDLQVSTEDAQMLADATHGKLVILPGVNHVLKDASRFKILNFLSYRDSKLPISEALVNAIAEFVHAHE